MYGMLLVLLLAVFDCSIAKALPHGPPLQQALTLADHEQERLDLITFGDCDTIGPFRIGTREAVWGANPLHGPGSKDGRSYPSSLVPGATVSWETASFNTSFDGREATIPISLIYDNVDWAFQQSIYGWAALQYQAFARCDLMYHRPDPIKILLYPTSVLELSWNSQTIFGGDFFGFERAPVVLHLLPGRNTIQLRLIYDIRANGAQVPPTINSNVKIKLLGHESAVTIPGSLVLPDVVEGRPASRYAGLTICNTGDFSLAVNRITDEDGRALDLSWLPDRIIAPGQSRQVPFQLVHDNSPVIPSAVVVHLYDSSTFSTYNVSIATAFQHRNIFTAHKITYPTFAGAITYGLLRPPPPRLSRDQTYALPVMISLHGAGVDVDSSDARHAFDQANDLPCWILTPSGGSLWSGDDWHVSGLFEILAALNDLQSWLIWNHWRGPWVKLEDFIVVGHSNGGQGAWQFAMHHPDHVVAAAILSAYSSIQNYVPYDMWSEADPRQTAVRESALSSYRHELYLSNLQRTPVIIQHGSQDDNVPIYNSRLMSTVAQRNSVNATLVEIDGAGHWFNGVMTTPSLMNFYQQYSKRDCKVAPPPQQFHFMVPQSDDVSTKYGIMVVQLLTPDRLGEVRVKTIRRPDNTTLWHIRTTNVRKLWLDSGRFSPAAVKLDEWPLIQESNETDISSYEYMTNGDGQWWRELVAPQNISERDGLQRGPMSDSILRSNGPIEIVYSSGSAAAYETAVQLSRNMLQYFGIDTNLRSSEKHETARQTWSNLITVVLGSQTPRLQEGSFCVEADENGVWLRIASSTKFIPSSEARGAAWLQPLHGESLELVIWGVDAEGVAQAARMAPTLTGVGQPDFVVFGKDAGWRGHAGTLAMGFFDYKWEISAGSYVP